MIAPCAECAHDAALDDDGHCPTCAWLPAVEYAVRHGRRRSIVMRYARERRFGDDQRLARPGPAARAWEIRAWAAWPAGRVGARRERAPT